MAANSTEILHDLTPIIKVYKDGRIERLIGLDVVPASVDPTTGVQSKDVEISPEIDLSARLYLPGNPNPNTKLPLLIYYHGGAFVVESTSSAQYHKHLNHLVAEANIIAVSVNYRLAPEHPLPIAFEDSWEALKWVFSQQDEWIQNHADMNRAFLGGDSAGGNIAHNMAMRVGSEKPDRVSLRGMFLNCPFFWGVDRIGIESNEAFSEMCDKMWHFACPGLSSIDEPWINPGKDPNISGLGCKRVLIYVAEKDVIKDRGWYYKEVLKNSGWGGEVECVEVAGEEHCFSVPNPDGENGKAMLKKVASFINE